MLEAELQELRREAQLSQNQGLRRTAHRFCDEREIDALTASIKKATVDSVVYEHMVSRLQHEATMTRQQVKKLEDHLQRKTGDLEKRKRQSRIVRERRANVTCHLGELKHDVDEERDWCVNALSDLDESLQEQWRRIRHKGEFDKWRCSVAFDAASQAHKASLNRYLKMWTVEKLVGNYLQSVLFEHTEHSLATEEGFQKIREVTGLSEVPDIVHKFVNREEDHDQLRGTVCLTEVRLQIMKKAKENRVTELTTDRAQDFAHLRPSLAADVQESEQLLQELQREQKEHQKKLQEDRLLMDSILQWGRRVSAHLDGLHPLECHADLPPFFQSLAKSVDTFFHQADREFSRARRSQLVHEAGERANVEQQRLLADPSFVRANLRVPLERFPDEDVRESVKEKPDGSHQHLRRQDRE